jgi:predicted N-acetyltransferase YhbS
VISARLLGSVGTPIVYQGLREEDDEAVKRLVELTFSRFLRGKFWEWKYLQNPSFDRAFVAVAKQDGNVIGCNHWLLRRVKLSDLTIVDGVLGADIAVHSEHRKKGVGRALMNFLRSQHGGKKLALLYMFANPELRRHFHAPIGGYVRAPHGTALYTRILNWSKLERNLAAFNEKVRHGDFQERLVNVDVTIVFKVRGAPPLCLHIDSHGVDADGSGEHADVSVSSDVATWSRIKGEEIGALRLIGLVLTGRVRFRGSLRKMWTVYRNRWIFREILRGKIT